MEFQRFTIGVLDLEEQEQRMTLSMPSFTKKLILPQQSRANTVQIETIVFYRNGQRKSRALAFDKVHRRCNCCLSHHIFPRINRQVRDEKTSIDQAVTITLSDQQV
jgi:hypothetical protein